MLALVSPVNVIRYAQLSTFGCYDAFDVQLHRTYHTARRVRRIQSRTGVRQTESNCV